MNEISIQIACEKYSQAIANWIENHHYSDKIKLHIYEKNNRISIDVYEYDESIWPYLWDQNKQKWLGESTLHDI
jgi:hypothetical protein